MHEGAEGVFGFERLDRFIMRNIGVEVYAEDILIKYSGAVPSLPISSSLSIPEILSVSLEQSRSGNQLSQGYCRSKKQWNDINTTRNVFRSEQWANIFRRIGDEYSLFLLENACIIQKIGENMVLLCGDISNIQDKKKEQRHVQREQLFRGRPLSLDMSANEALQAVMNEIEVSPENLSILGDKIKKMIRKYQKLPLKAIFKSYIIEKPSNCTNRHSSSGSEHLDMNIIEEQIRPETIADFLFLISKKFLRPAFNLRSFKILKGKIVLLLKRNAFETLNSEDLSNHFKMSSFKLFSQCKNLSNSARMSILKNLMLFLFNSIFLKIIGYFFYSTTASSTKLKVYYFTRISWNSKAGKFIHEYLKTFECCERTGSFATLRCIPKEDGFRVVTNCSRLTSYGSRKCLKQPAMARDLSVERLSNRYQDIGEILNDKGIGCANKHQEEAVHRAIVRDRVHRRFNNNSINSQVSSIVPIVKKIASDISGSSLLCHFHAGKRLFPFLRSRGGRMILVKVDLSRCFDNISHSNLVSFIDNVLCRDEYYFREFGVVRENKQENRVEIKYLKHAPDVLYPMNIAEAQPDDLGYLKQGGMCILKENKTKVISRADVFKKITGIIENSTILYQNRHYASTKGIPQGCSISPLLCSIYFSILDQKFPNLDWLVVRFVDDFLIVTETPGHIKKFFEVADLLKDEGFIVNPSKISSNVDLSFLNESGLGLDEQITFVSDHVEWCGMKVYDQGVGIKSICKDPHFKYAVSISVSNRGKRIFDKIKRSLNIKLSKMYVNKLNRKLGECIFDALFFCGRRLKIMMHRLDFINSNFVARVLSWCVNEVENVLGSRNIVFDKEKIENISNTAYERCGIKNIKKRIGMNRQ